jgi:hypothetical protein
MAKTTRTAKYLVKNLVASPSRVSRLPVIQNHVARIRRGPPRPKTLNRFRLGRNYLLAPRRIAEGVYLPEGYVPPPVTATVA